MYYYPIGNIGSSTARALIETTHGFFHVRLKLLEIAEKKTCKLYDYNKSVAIK